MIYLDYAATSWPKPAACIRAMEEFLVDMGSNPSYSRHQRAIKGEEIINQARKDVGWVLGAKNPEHVIFTLNATSALNLAINGFLKPGNRIITSNFEHCSVARPLVLLAKKHGMKIERIGDPKTGVITEEDIHKSLEKEPANLFAVVHASNVTGTIQPIDQLVKAAHSHGCAVLLDTAQTAGVLPINADKWEIDFLAFSGHKHLLGPMGVGGLYIRDPEMLDPVVIGSTGYFDSDDNMPECLPNRYEAGTHNAPGIAALGATCRAIREKGIASIRKDHQDLTRRVIQAFGKIPNLKLYGPTDARKKVGVLSFNIEKLKPEDVGNRLDTRFDIMVRTGLCSAHWAHESLGTLPDGVVRASLGYFTKEEETDLLIEAVEMIASEAN